MAMKRKTGRSLSYATIQRFVVVGCPENKKKKRKGGRLVYTNVVDAMLVARRCSRPNEFGISRRIDVLYGLPGAEGRIASCEDRKCKTPGGKAVPMRKLYEAEQRGSAAAAFDETIRRHKRKRTGGSVPVKARKTKARKKKMPKWKAELITRAKARKAA